MENTVESKYQKLAQEYSKLRAQATVLKKAVLEEQEENTNLKDQLQKHQAALRRSEQETDSLGFRNMQLEHRVSVLQEELATREGRKKDYKRGFKTEDLPIQANANVATAANVSELAQDAIIFEELQKKIQENAELATLVDERERDLHSYAERIASLEISLQKQTIEQSELDKRYRLEVSRLQTRNAEIEAKLIEATNIFDSEDVSSVSENDITSLHNTNVIAHNASDVPNIPLIAVGINKDERVTLLEKEVIMCRAQLELVKLENETSKNNIRDDISHGCCSTAAVGLVVKLNCTDSNSGNHTQDVNAPTMTAINREQKLFNHFSKKYEELLKKTHDAESRVQSYITENENLQNCLEDATENIKVAKNRLLQIEEDLSTTRVNYEEQISVLTEQVINLSDQLVACK